MSERQKIAVDIWLPRCPRCGGSDLKHYGTRKNPKGETIRYYRCRKPGCATKFPGRVMNADDEDQGDEFSDSTIPPERSD